MYFDSHCHLTSEPLAPQFAEVLERARQNEVSGFLNIGDNLASSNAAVEQAKAAQEHGVKMWATAGVHPQSALQYVFEADESEAGATASVLQALAANPLVRAVGEIGLDFVYDETHAQYPGANRDRQEAAFREQLEVAIATRLPVVIHNREADDRLLAIVSEYASRLAGGVFHCFGSRADVARRVLDLGFHLGFTGLITFKNADEVREVAKLCPLARLLIETDSPYLAPVPHRGKTNEPSYLPRVAETIAQLHGKTPEAIGEITTRNAIQLFKLPTG